MGVLVEAGLLVTTGLYGAAGKLVSTAFGALAAGGARVSAPSWGAFPHPVKMNRTRIDSRANMVFIRLFTVWLLAPVWSVCNQDKAVGVPAPGRAVCGKIRGFPGQIRPGTRRFARASGRIVQSA